MAEDSDNPQTTPDNSPITPDAPLQEEAAPAPVPEEEKRPRGRPKGSKDAKPRIRRVPVVIEQEEEEAPAAPKRGAKEPERLPDQKLAVSFDHAPEPEEQSSLSLLIPRRRVPARCTGSTRRPSLPSGASSHRPSRRTTRASSIGISVGR